MNSAEKELQDSLIIQLCNARTSGYSEKLDQFHSVPRQCTGNPQSCWTSLITDYENFKRIIKKKQKKQAQLIIACAIITYRVKKKQHIRARNADDSGNLMKAILLPLG